MYAIYTDARDGQMGCLLFQKQPNGHKRPTRYLLHSLTGAGRKYDTIYGECLAFI